MTQRQEIMTWLQLSRPRSCTCRNNLKSTPMKTTSLLSRIAALGVVSSVAAVIAGVAALPVFIATASFLVLMIAFTDYGTRPHFVRTTPASISARVEAMPLAA